MEQVTMFIHQGSIGDVWASIPSMREYHRKTNKKIVLYLVNGIKAFYYEGATHPTVDEAGSMVMLNETVINMMIPLFKAQPFIHDVKIWGNQPYHVDLGKIRDTFVNMPYGDLRRWYFIVYPDTSCDISKKYIDLPETDVDYAKDKILITRSERYNNPDINYKFIKKYEQDVLFCGTELEYVIFKIKYGLNIERLVINNFLELAHALNQCKFHISNQTQAFQISEGLKTPRVVELCKYAPNVQPIGENAFEFYSQNALEHHVKILNGDIPESKFTGFTMPPILNTLTPQTMR